MSFNLLIMIFTYATWSSVFSISKITLKYCSPVFLTSIRMLFAGILLITYLSIRKKLSLKALRSHIIPIILLALFSIYLTNIFEFWGVQYLSAAKTCFIYSLTPFFAAILSYFHFKEKMNTRKWLGLSIGFIGMIPVFFTQTGSEKLFGGISFISWPELAIMGAAFFSVYGWVLLRLLVKDKTLSPVAANGYSMLLGGIMALIHSLLIDKWSPVPIINGGFIPFMQGTIIITFISNIVCYNLYGWLLKKYTATFMSFIGLLSPFFASINGWIFLGEAPSATIFMSTSIVTLGLWLVYKAELKQGYITKKAKKNQQEQTAA